MRTVSIINLKGGVGKTVTAINLAWLLAERMNQRVLLVDNDKQGNTTKTFAAPLEGYSGMSAIMTDKHINMWECILPTRIKNLSLVGADMSLIGANLSVMYDHARPQQTRLAKALRQVDCSFDWCIIDNAPDINISTINALVASQDVIVPVKIDEYAFDGLAEIAEQIDIARAELNDRLRFTGVLPTCCQRTEGDRQGEQYLRDNSQYPVFQSRIRWSEKVTESTFAKRPVVEYSPRCGASHDYQIFLAEFLELVGGEDDGAI